MNYFWDGFEKRALSPKLLRRAADAAKKKADEAIAKGDLDKVIKRVGQTFKFEMAAGEKHFDHLLNSTREHYKKKL